MSTANNNDRRECSPAVHEAAPWHRLIGRVRYTIWITDPYECCHAHPDCSALQGRTTTAHWLDCEPSFSIEELACPLCQEHLEPRWLTMGEAMETEIEDWQPPAELSEQLARLFDVPEK